MVEEMNGLITVASIKNHESNKGTTFWGCKTNKGFEFTAWDKTIAENIENNLNIECDATMKSTDEGQHWNIRAFTPVNQPKPKPMAINNQQTTIKPQMGSSKIVSIENKTDRDKSIIAQCLTKVWGDTQDKEKNCEDVLTAYNYFLEKL